MVNSFQSAGGGFASGSAQQTGSAAFSGSAGARAGAEMTVQPVGVLRPLPLRVGNLPLHELIDLYMAHYSGRDGTRVHRLSWWLPRVGDLALQDLTDDHIDAELQQLANCSSRYFAGRDAEGNPQARPRPSRVECTKCGAYYVSAAYCPKCQIKLQW